MQQEQRITLPARDADGTFTSFDEWVNKATSWIGGTNALCADAQGRVCQNGGDMQRARDEDAFPVRFWLGAGSQTAKEQRKALNATRRAIGDFKLKLREAVSMAKSQTASCVEITAGGYDWAWRPSSNIAEAIDEGPRVVLPGTLEPSLPAVAAFLEGWCAGRDTGRREGHVDGAERAKAAIRQALGVPSCESVGARLALIEDNDTEVRTRLGALERRP